MNFIDLNEYDIIIEILNLVSFNGSVILSEIILMKEISLIELEFIGLKFFFIFDLLIELEKRYIYIVNINDLVYLKIEFYGKEEYKERLMEIYFISFGKNVYKILFLIYIYFYLV